MRSHFDLTHGEHKDLRFICGPPPRLVALTLKQTCQRAILINMAGCGELDFAVELRIRFRPFCEKHHIRRLEVFGSAARGQAGPGSDVDLLVTLDESVPVSTAALLEMAGEAEELVGAPVDFVLRPSLEKSRNSYARDHILSTSVCVYGS